MLCVAWSFAPAAAAQEPTRQSFELKEGDFRAVEVPDPNTPEGQLHLIRQAIADKQGKQAVALADQWIKRYPNHPMLPEAYLLRGDAKIVNRDYFLALFDYEFLLRAYPSSPQFEVALEREFHIAQAFDGGMKRRLWGMRILPADGEAEELYIRIQERSPGSKIAEKAGIALADFYYRRSDMPMAAEAYGLFLQNYPESQWREHAMLRQIMANLARFKGPKFDMTGLIEAQTRLQDYQAAYPAAAEQVGVASLLIRIDESMAERHFLVAQWYDDQDKPVSAIYMYKRVIQDHPRSAAARKALARLQELDPNLFAEQPDAAEDKAPAVAPAPTTDEGGDQ